MGTALSFLLRLAAALTGIAFSVALWYALPASLSGLMGADMGFGLKLLAATQLLAVTLIPPALLTLSWRPRLWRFALIPVAWAVVATILVYPRSLDFLF